MPIEMDDIAMKPDGIWEWVKAISLPDLRESTSIESSYDLGYPAGGPHGELTSIGIPVKW